MILIVFLFAEEWKEFETEYDSEPIEGVSV